MMDWKITYARRWNRNTKSYDPAEIEERFGDDSIDELIALIQQAFNDGIEIQVALTEHDPTPQFLFDNDGGEPPITLDEMYKRAVEEKRLAHS
jgi:hypothetical protein